MFVKLVEHSGNGMDCFSQAITEILKNEDVKSLLILSCDANGFTPEIMNPVLKSVPVPLLGGIFPFIFYGKERFETGSLVVGLTTRVRTVVIPGLNDDDADFVAKLDHMLPEVTEVKTMLVFLDGLSKRIGAFIDSLFTVFGLESNYVGGGAGSVSMIPKPCLFTNQGMVRDSAVLALLDVESGIGVNHGWQSVGGPFRVTESQNNKVISLDWKPAFQVYREAVEAHSGQHVEKENFFHTTKGYPFGIARIGAESVVRDPVLVTDDDALVCVGEVPEGVYIDLMTGNDESLLAAAAKAKQLGLQALKPGIPGKVTLFIDCISRVLFLGDDFSKELEAVYDETCPLIGACTIGEIANSGSDYLEYYNKTSVVAQLEEL